MQRIRTVGHGTLAAADLMELLRAAGVDAVADVRRYPASRRHPQFGREALTGWLGEAGISYLWLPALGGRRRVDGSSPNVALRNAQFRAYADHMATAEFSGGVTDLEAYAAERSVAVMCAESLWWHCHRRLLADHLVLVEHLVVEHLFHDGRLARHDPAPEARVAGRVVVYDRGAQHALFDP
jgi:uncharacterized protein (DUF488 family)